MFDILTLNLNALIRFHDIIILIIVSTDLTMDTFNRVVQDCYSIIPLLIATFICGIF